MTANYAICNEHFINPKNNIYYKIYNNMNLEPYENIENIASNNDNTTNNIFGQGKQVILVDSDNPWYINVSADKIPAKYKQIDFDKLNGYTGQKHNATFNTQNNNNISNKFISTYSLKERLYKLTKMEGFSNGDNNYIVLSVLFIFLIIIIRYIKK